MVLYATLVEKLVSVPHLQGISPCMIVECQCKMAAIRNWHQNLTFNVAFDMMSQHLLTGRRKAHQINYPKMQCILWIAVFKCSRITGWIFPFALDISLQYEVWKVMHLAERGVKYPVPELQETLLTKTLQVLNVARGTLWKNMTTYAKHGQIALARQRRAAIWKQLVSKRCKADFHLLHPSKDWRLLSLRKKGICH